MGNVTASIAVPGSVREAERRWYDTSRWPDWVDGLDHIVALEGDWPEVGASVIWQSGPAGRGRVNERVIAYEALAGQTTEVDDPSMTGRQSVTFTPEEGGVRVALSLEYRIARRSILTPLVDVLFVRRAVAASLQATLGRFAAACAGR